LIFFENYPSTVFFYYRTGLAADDPRWVGAWWIGFICSFLLFLVFALPLFGFGKELPSKYNYKAIKKVVPKSGFFGVFF
jgi:hypothetical protein